MDKTNKIETTDKDIINISAKTVTATIETKFEQIYQICQSCGIFKARLTDPLSSIIAKILNLSDIDYNTIGLYYEVDTDKYNIIMFYIHNGVMIPWIKAGTTLNFLLNSCFVSRLAFMPFIADKTINRPLRLQVIQLLTEYPILDLDLNYTSLFLNSTHTPCDIKHGTGYSPINKILYFLAGYKAINIPCEDVEPCNLLKDPITFNNPRTEITDLDIKNLLPDIRKDLLMLVSVFLDLYTSNSKFRDIVLHIEVYDILRTVNVRNLFLKENELLSHIIGGIQGGSISNNNLNELITEVESQRWKLGNFDTLPRSHNPATNVNIITADVTSVQFLSHINTNVDAIRQLGTYINVLIDIYQRNEPMIIHLGGLVSLYNDILKDSDVFPKIIIPDYDLPTTISRTATVTMPGKNDNNQLQIDHHGSFIAVPIYNSDLTNLTEGQLIDVLIYIDSLRDFNGNSDKRFANINNDIIRELARRQQIISETNNK